MKTYKIFGLVTVVLLLGMDWLTFHDIHEFHSTRDWLTLLVSVLAIGCIWLSYRRPAQA